MAVYVQGKLNSNLMMNISHKKSKLVTEITPALKTINTDLQTTKTEVKDFNVILRKVRYKKKKCQ